MPIQREPVRVSGGLIRINLNWWNSRENDLGPSEDDRFYLCTIIRDTACPPGEHVAFVVDTPRARQILGLEQEKALCPSATT